MVNTSSEAAVEAPELREIRGPAALTGDAKRFWRLLWHMAKSDFKLKYQGSILGYLWSLASPLMLFGILYLVFTEVVRFGGVENYAAVLIINIMLFQFFGEATSSAMTSIVWRETLVRKMEFPRLVIPLSVVLASTFTLALNLIVVFFFLVVITGLPVLSTWVLLPVLIAWLYVFTVGTSLLLAMVYVRFRDTAQIWTVISLVLFYGSPVLFPIELFPAGWKALLLLNPLAPLFAQARVWLVDPGAPTFAEAMGGAVYWIYPLVTMVAVSLLGAWLFDRDAPRVAEQL
jgi:ABC-2 type transport system permease protein